MRVRWVISAVLLLSACGAVEGTVVDAPPGSEDGAIDGAVDAETVDCSPPDTTTCDDATGRLTVCDATGHGTVTTCPLGCHATEERCIDVAPSNNLGAYLDMTPTAPAVDLPDGTQIDTMTGTVTTPTGTVAIPSMTVTQAGNPTIRVFMVSSIILNDVTVTGANAFAIVSNGLVSIQGRVSATANAHNAGPGAATCLLTNGLGGTGVHPGSSNVNFRGGGGGGFGANGARGGHSGTLLTDGGAAGLASPAAASTLIPLRGGCTGGGSDHPDGNGIINVGGGGGGAVQIVSRTQISIVQNAEGAGGINVGGGGGPAGPNNPTGYTGGGGGGGSGGGVLLEAPIVLVTGTGAAVAASGGGGGGGCANQPGATGRDDATPAVGGTCAGASITSGGAGGLSTYNGATVAPVQGVDTPGAEPRQAGGGGGGVGRIRINNGAGSFTVGAGAGVYGATTIGTVATR